MKYLAALLGLASVSFLAPSARADVSSWVYVGGGATTLEQRGLSQRVAPTLALEAGMGTPATSPLVLGGMFKLSTLFGEGADLGLSLRLASRGFVTGGFGLALDAGPYRRFWGERSTGGHAALVLGAPWGITLSVGGGVGSKDAKQLGATLGLDFARLTIYRLSGESWLPNPHPAFRPKK